MKKEFEYAKNVDEASKAHTQWWMSLSPYEMLKANIEHNKYLAKANPDLFKFPEKRFILK